MKQDNSYNGQSGQIKKNAGACEQKEQKKGIPQTGTGTTETNSGGSMSEGNLSNSRYSRE